MIFYNKEYKIFYIHYKGDCFTIEGEEEAGREGGKEGFIVFVLCYLYYI